MNIKQIVNSVKIDLGITTNAYDSRLTEYVKAAIEEIKREGVVLKDNPDDSNLATLYAAWMWKKRDTGEGIPRMIRWQLNNRLFGKRGTESE